MIPVHTIGISLIAVLFMGVLSCAALAGAQRPSGFTAYVVSHTHSDFAWADYVERCLGVNAEAVGKAVELAQRDPDFRFTMEHVLAVREYLRRHPEQRETLARLMGEGRFEVGGLYTGPWELTAGAEPLVRQLVEGKLWVKRNLGHDVTTVWQVDVAGHTAQLPQILHKAGIRGMAISAGQEGLPLFNWLGPDGSGVLVWTTPWGYGAGLSLGLRRSTLDEAIEKIPRFLADVAGEMAPHNLPKVAFIADGTDILLPDGSVTANIRRWNAERRDPPMEHASTARLFAAVEKAPLPAFGGEMPSPWDTVQSQGNECFMADRILDGRVLAAEKLAAFVGLADPSFAYPKDALDAVWQNRLLVHDHNWGGTRGAESNALKARKIAEARDLTDQVLGRACAALAGSVRFAAPGPQAVPVLLFNPLSWDRKDVVECDLPIRRGEAARLLLADATGRRIAYQLAADQPAGSQTSRLVFLADVPSLGYTTVYARLGPKPAAARSPFLVDAARNAYENRTYRLTLDPTTGGIASLIDKRTSRELIRQGSRYACGELVAFEDDEVDIKLHLTGRHWSSREHPSTIRVVEDGSVRLVIEIAGRLLDQSTRTQRITLYAGLPRIDLETRLEWEGRRNVQLYQAFPLDVAQPTVRYAVPFGSQEYGREMKYAAPWPFGPLRDRPWRGVRGWVDLRGRQGSVALASQCNYAAFRDLAEDPEDGLLVQPLLLRTVRSCGDEKLYYQQKGPRAFRFALQPGADAPRLGEELDSPVVRYVVPPADAQGGGSLPDRQSFLSVRPAGVHVSAVKQAEDGSGLVVRLVEMAQRAQPVRTEVRIFRPVRQATRTNIIEEGGQPLALRDGAAALPVGPAAIETMRLVF